jgi:translin
MIDKTIFEKLKKEIEERDLLREKLIVNSRPVMKESKQAIYALHRDNIDEAKEKLALAKEGIKALSEYASDAASTGAYSQALQEYAEAATYFYYVTEDRLVSPEEINVDGENYLLGLTDLTGELARRAVFSVVSEKYDEIKKIQEFVEVIYNNFMEFELRNSELRKKSDSIKWNMKKIEEIMYDLKIREKI